jgi:ligand-binding SRPBCC domain-containing protein
LRAAAVNASDEKKLPKIEITTFIKAPIERVFDLSRSIDLHTRTASQTNETAVDGRTTGLIGLDETVTWNARHFGFNLSHQSKIVEYSRPYHFRDTMLAGMFARLDHDHGFEETDGGTVMNDLFDFDSPYWPIGKLVDFVFLENYMRRFLLKRNSMIREFAESDEWKRFIV